MPKGCRKGGFLRIKCKFFELVRRPLQKLTSTCLSSLSLPIKISVPDTLNQVLAVFPAHHSGSHLQTLDINIKCLPLSLPWPTASSSFWARFKCHFLQEFFAQVSWDALLCAPIALPFPVIVLMLSWWLAYYLTVPLDLSCPIQLPLATCFYGTLRVWFLQNREIPYMYNAYQILRFSLKKRIE